MSSADLTHWKGRGSALVAAMYRCLADGPRARCLLSRLLRVADGAAVCWRAHGPVEWQCCRQLELIVNTATGRELTGGTLGCVRVSTTRASRSNRAGSSRNPLDALREAGQPGNDEGAEDVGGDAVDVAVV